MFVVPATLLEIDSLMVNLKFKRMSDENDIPRFFLKLAENTLSFPLAFMINHSFSLGIFTKTLKTGKVLPIFKKGFPYFLLFRTLMNMQFTIELFHFLTATISLLGCSQSIWF